MIFSIFSLTLTDLVLTGRSVVWKKKEWLKIKRKKRSPLAHSRGD